jgi:hypothetical protein
LNEADSPASTVLAGEEIVPVKGPGVWMVMVLELEVDGKLAAQPTHWSVVLR